MTDASFAIETFRRPERNITSIGESRPARLAVAAAKQRVTTLLKSFRGLPDTGVDMRAEKAEMTALSEEHNRLTTQTEAVSQIHELMDQPAKHLAKVDGAIKTTRFLERERRKWQDGIQVLLYNEDANTTKKAEIGNFALKTDETGRIIERQSLIFNKDGTIDTRIMKKSGRRWVGHTLPASNGTITEAVQAMNNLHKAEARQPEEPSDTARNPGEIHDEGFATSASVSSEATPLSPEIQEERKPAIKNFAVDFLLTLNPYFLSELPSDQRREKLITLLAQEEDIFSTTTEEKHFTKRSEVERLRGYNDMRSLAQYYDKNPDAFIPQRTIVLGSELDNGPFDDKVLVYIEDEFTNFGKIRAMSYRRSQRATLSDVKEIVTRQKNDVLAFEGGEGKKRPDVYLKSVSDTAVEKKGLRHLKPKRIDKESFTMTGCESVIVGGNIKPDIPTFNIECEKFTVLPDASLKPAPFEGDIDISIKAGNDVNLPIGSTLGASSINCVTFHYDGELENPHRNIKRVEITCDKIVDSHENPLNPQLFHIDGDQDYIARQTAIAEVVHTARLGSEGELHAMDRSEQVSNFALNFFCQLNRKYSDAERDRIAMELFGRGAEGNFDNNIFAGTLRENLRQWDTDEKKKSLSEQSLTRGVEDMLRLVDYYKAHPNVELPTQIIILGNQKELDIDPREKPLIFWEEAWEEVFNKTEIKRYRGDPYYSTAVSREFYSLNRPLSDGYTFDQEKKPDLYIKNMGQKRRLTLTGFENILVEGNVESGIMGLDVSCSGDLVVAPKVFLDSKNKSSSVQAGELTLAGNIGVSKIQCKTFNRGDRSIIINKWNLDDPTKKVKLVCEEYNGDPPNPDIIDLITSS